MKKKQDELESSINEEEEKKEDLVLTLEEDLQKSKLFIAKLEDWLKGDSSKPLEIDEQSSFFRRHIYEYIKNNHPKLVGESVPRPDNSREKVLTIYNFTEEERQAHREQKQKERQDYHNKGYGFARVIQLLIDAKKPMLGHNCYFDFLFFMHSFVENLPYDYNDFKRRVRHYFPT